MLFLRRYSSSPPPITESTVLAGLRSYSGDWRRAFEFFNWSSSPPQSFSHTPSTFSLAIDILSKHLQFPLSLSLFHQLHLNSSSSSIPSSVYRSLFSRLAAARHVSEAINLLRYSPNSSTFISLIDSLCDRRLTSQAVDLISNPPFGIELVGDEITKVNNIILHGWLRMGAFNQCHHQWKDMDLKCIHKDLHSHSVYLTVLNKCGKPKRAIRLYEKMKKCGFELDVVAYNAVVHAAGIVDGPEAAVRIYREMVEAGCKPSVSTFNVMIKLFCEEGRIGEAKGYLSRMRELGCKPDVVTYHCFFRSMDRPQEILKMFDEMVANGCKPRVDTYTMLIKKFGRWGFLRPVFVMWDSMLSRGCSPDAFAYNALIDALVKKGMTELARKYDEEMLAKGLSAKPRKGLGTRGLGVDSEDNALNNVF